MSDTEIKATDFNFGPADEEKVKDVLTAIMDVVRKRCANPLEAAIMLRLASAYMEHEYGIKVNATEIDKMAQA